jgi:predicted nucleic acid-binding protein
VAIALDSNAVIGFLDRGDALHSAATERIAETLREGDALVVSVITFIEVLTGATLGRHDEGAVRGFLEGLVAEIVPVDVEVGRRGAELRGKHRALRLPDALILATAEIHPQVTRLVSGDRAAARVPGLGCPVELLAPAAR